MYSWKGPSMERRVLISLLICSLILLMVAVLSSCSIIGNGSNNDPEIVDGGTTINNDEDAPKVIESKEITAFSFNCYSANRFDREDNSFFDFSIEGGKLTEKESGRTVVIPEEGLMDLQKIIDEHSLVSFNGEYRVTAGLPPEYEASTFFVRYASGEQLYFTYNNNPYAAYLDDIYDLFASWYEASGDEYFYPIEDYDIDDVSLNYYGTEDDEAGSLFDGFMHMYQTVEEEGTIYLSKYMQAEDALVEVPSDFFERVGEITRKYHLIRNYSYSYYNHEAGNYSNHDLGYYGMGKWAEGFDPEMDITGEEDSENKYLEVYISYSDDYRIPISTKKPSEIAGLMPMVNELVEYFESLY